MRKLIGFYSIKRGERIRGNSGHDLYGLVINAYREGPSADGPEFFYPAILAPVALVRGTIGTLDRNPKVRAITESQGTKSLRFPSLLEMNEYIKGIFGDFEFRTPEYILGD